MAIKKKPLPEIKDVSQKMLEKFLDKITEAEVSKEVVARLRETVLSKEKPSDQALKTALFSTTPNL